MRDFGRRGYVTAPFRRCTLLPARIYRRGFDLRAFDRSPFMAERIVYMDVGNKSICEYEDYLVLQQ